MTAHLSQNGLFASSSPSPAGSSGGEAQAGVVYLPRLWRPDRNCRACRLEAVFKRQKL